MTIEEYKRRVIDLYKSGRATDEQWEAMAECVHMISDEQVLECVDLIDEDKTIGGGPLVTCETCGAMYYPDFGHDGYFNQGRCADNEE